MRISSAWSLSERLPARDKAGNSKHTASITVEHRRIIFMRNSPVRSYIFKFNTDGRYEQAGMPGQKNRDPMLIFHDPRSG